MPAYKTLTIPTALYPGDIGLSFNAEVVGVDGTAGERFAISPSPTGVGALGGFSTEFSWDVAPANTTIVSTEMANTDADTNYIEIDSHTFNGTETTYRFDGSGLSPSFVRTKVKTHDSNGHKLTSGIRR